MAIDGFDDSAKERLSALADGELGPAESTATCAAWTGDAGLRADWHAWHLIGDVLRSDDLASEFRHDREFCAGLRSRLQAEPVVLAPAPALAGKVPRIAEAPARRRGWTTAGAVAAGLVLVIGTFAVVRPGESPTARIAQVDALPAATALTAAAPRVADPVAIVADNKVIRDAQLERYLEAHKQFAGTSALGVPSSFLRSATVDSAGR